MLNLQGRSRGMVRVENNNKGIGVWVVLYCTGPKMCA
jgi:hypothetical protein